MGLEARIWASGLGFGPQDWDLGLETGILAWRLGFEGGYEGEGGGGEGVCVKAKVIDPFGAAAQNGRHGFEGRF